MSAQEIDQYLDVMEEPKRTTLARLRQTILEILPEAEQGISYGVPAFKVRGKTGQRRPDSPPARSEASTGPPEAAASRHGPAPGAGEVRRAACRPHQ